MRKFMGDESKACNRYNETFEFMVPNFEYAPAWSGKNREKDLLIL